MRSNSNLKVLLFVSLYFFSLPLFSQSKKIKSFTADDEIISVSVDRAGDFYLVLKNGAIQKFDKDGEKISAFTDSKTPTSFDPTNAIRLLTYYKAEQKYTWLSPTLENPGFQLVEPSWAIEPVYLCPAGDLNLWILDAADESLKKINLSQSQVLYEFRISKELSSAKIKSIREYQNFVFILDEEKGIYIYNSIGKLIRKIEAKGILWFNFLGEELYYGVDKKIEFLDLYSVEKRNMPLPDSLKFILFTDERMLKVTEKKQVEILEYKP
jgi:hypothetical protein